MREEQYKLWVKIITGIVEVVDKHRKWCKDPKCPACKKQGQSFTIVALYIVYYSVLVLVLFRLSRVYYDE